MMFAWRSSGALTTAVVEVGEQDANSAVSQ
jgi:hypothetical protein